MSTVNNPDISLLAAKAGHMGRLTKGGKLLDCFHCCQTASNGPGLRTLGSSVWSHLSISDLPLSNKEVAQKAADYFSRSLQRE